jgi:hypothetical protein|tara:strand:- start:1236 stop:1361 length:126 start_codon:yes stop_codon:yes gene_type:complete
MSDYKGRIVAKKEQEAAQAEIQAAYEAQTLKFDIKGESGET